MALHEDVVALLELRGARGIEHPGGSLLEHLVRTSELLRSWGASLVEGLGAAPQYPVRGLPTCKETRIATGAGGSMDGESSIKSARRILD